jgi:hypothetical protein
VSQFSFGLGNSSVGVIGCSESSDALISVYGAVAQREPSICYCPKSVFDPLVVVGDWAPWGDVVFVAPCPKLAAAAARWAAPDAWAEPPARIGGFGGGGGGGGGATDATGDGALGVRNDIGHPNNSVAEIVGPRHGKV